MIGARSRFELAEDRLLPYPGFNGTLGLWRVRVHRRRGSLVIVIVGTLDDCIGRWLGALEGMESA